MKAEVSCRNLRSAVEYTRSQGGDGAVEALVRAARLVEPAVSEQLLVDDTAWVSSEVFRTVLEAAERVLDDPEASRKIGTYYEQATEPGASLCGWPAPTA